MERGKRGPKIAGHPVSCARAAVVVWLPRRFLPKGRLVNTPMALSPFNEDEYRDRVRVLSDDKLINEGKQLRSLCGGVVSAGPPCVFDINLRI